MGAWGTAIASNDTYADVYGNFFDLYNEGLNVKDISEKLIFKNQGIINCDEDKNNFWFAIAKAQWECKELDGIILERVKTIIESGADIELWKDLDASNSDLKKRQIALEKFLNILTTDRLKAKPRKKKIIRQPVFEKGDCLTFKLENGNFGGAIVLEAVKDTEYGLNLIAATRINQSKLPNKIDFQDTEVLILNYASWDNKQIISWYNPVRYKSIAHLIEIVEKVDIEIDYDLNKSMYSYMANFGLYIIDAINQQFKHEETNSRSSKKIRVKDLIKKKWKFW